MLPRGYTRLQYIESTGTQYINTGFKPNQDTRVIFSGYNLSTSSSWIYGTRHANGNTQFCANGQNTYSVRYGTGSAQLGTLPVGDFDIDQNKNAYSYNGTTGTITAQTFACDYPMYLFAINAAGSVSTGRFTGRLYSCQIYDNGVLIRNFIPCQDSTGEVGLWDIVNSEFYPNLGTGEFVAGAVEVFSPLVYLESTGTQYIDTNFYPNQNTRVVVTAKFGTKPASTAAIFGARNSNANRFYLCYRGGNSDYAVGYGANSANNSFSTDPLVKTTYDLNKNVATVGTNTLALTEATFTSAYSLYLFAFNNAGSTQYASAVAIYSCQIYDNGTLIRDYVPMKNTAGDYGLYDRLNQVFYRNRGTDTFIGQEVITSVGQVLDYKYTGAVQNCVLPKGKFLLECWGAQGSYTGGLGGYSHGILELTEETPLFLYVGGCPPTDYSGGFNGGGKGCYRSYDEDSTYCYGGGGGTDIRLLQDSLYARVIVAGGGGGKTSQGSAITTTCYGGGLTGGCGYSGGGGTQTAGGVPSDSAKSGSFGQGRDSTGGTNYNYGCGGGGGGWYGGGANHYSDSTTYYSYAGGGSGYVYTADTANNYPSGCLLNEAYYLTEAETIGGNQTFVNPETGASVTGRSGNGYIRITVLGLSGIEAPANLQADLNDDTVTLSWDAVSEATAYFIIRDDINIAEVEGTEYTMQLHPFSNAICGVAATNGEATSEVAEVLVQYIPDALNLITDRTLNDVQYIAYLRKKGWAAMTEDERNSFLAPLKGSYNASDFNRVEYAAQHLAELLRQLPTELQEYADSLNVEWQPLFDVPYTAFELEVKYDWTVRDIPDDADAARYLGNVTLLRNTLDYATTVLPNSMEKLTHVGANAIELALENLFGAIADFRNLTQTRIQNTTAAWFYSGEIYGGDF